MLGALALWPTFSIPLYGEICSKDGYAGQKERAAYNVALVALWHISKFLEDHSGTITAIATALLAYITWKLVSLGRDQEQTNKQQLRAYVLMRANSIRDICIGSHPVVEVEVMNYGRTPANNFRVNIGPLVFDEFANASSLPALQPIDDRVGGREVLGPGGPRTLTFRLNVAMDAARIAQLTARTHAIFAYGEIHYRDVFERKHTTNFRLFVGGPIGVAPGVIQSLVAHDEGNEAT